MQAPPEYDHKCWSYLAKLLLHVYSFSFRSYIRLRVRLCAAFLEGRCHKGLPAAEIPVAAWFQCLPTFMSISSGLRLVGQEVCVKLLTPKVSFCSLGRPMQFNTLIRIFPCNRWDEIDAEAASQHQEKLARAGKHPSQGVIFFGLPS